MMMMMIIKRENEKEKLKLNKKNHEVARKWKEKYQETQKKENSMRNNKEYKLKLSLKKTFMLLSVYIDYLFKKNEKGRKYVL